MLSKISLQEEKYLFRYVSEWNPRKHAQTKGGYVMGHIKVPPIPKGHKSIRMTLETFPVEKVPDVIQNVHPLILHLVKMGKGKREQDKEPVPNSHHWRLIFTIEKDGRVFVENETSPLDENEDGTKRDIPKMDMITRLEPDNRIVLSNKKGHLNVVILTPKQDARAVNAHDGEATVGTVLTDRTKHLDPRPDVKEMTKVFRSAQYMMQVRLKATFYTMIKDEWSQFNSCVTERPIINIGSKVIGALEIYDAHPLISCSRGGRKINIISEYDLAENTVPVFQVWDQHGNRRYDQEELLEQVPTKPEEDRRQINVKKTVITFLTPPQPRLLQMESGMRIKLTLLRSGDNQVANNAFDFTYMPHSHRYCVFCQVDIDCHGPGVIREPAARARPGNRKKRMVKPSSEDQNQNQVVAKRSCPINRDMEMCEEEEDNHSTTAETWSDYSSIYSPSVSSPGPENTVRLQEIPRMDEFADPGTFDTLWNRIDTPSVPEHLLTEQDPYLESISMEDLVCLSEFNGCND